MTDLEAEEATPRTRVEHYAPLVAGALLAAPTLLAHYPPMSDLPLHEGVVGILRHYGDPAYFPSDLYTLNFGHANQLFHVLACGLSYLVGTAWAVKLVIAASQFLILALGARFADHLGRSRWSVLLLAPLALGFTYYWGLVANLVGFAALLGVLPVIDRAAEKPSGRGAATVCGLTVVVFFAHEAIFVAAIGLLGMLAVAYPFERRKTVLRFVPVAFALLFLAVQHWYQSRFFTRGQLTPPMKFAPFLEKVFSLPNVLFGSHEFAAQLMLLFLTLVALAVMVSARVKAHIATPRAVAEGRTKLRALRDGLLKYRFELTALGFLFLYFVMPFQWKGATLVYERFLGPAWALIVICASAKQTPRIAKLVVSVLPVGILLLAWPQFVDSDQSGRDLDVVMAAIPLNSSVALCSLDRPVFRTRIYSGSVGPARTVARRGGRMSPSLVISPLSAVQIRPEYRWDEFDLRTFSRGSREMQPAHDLERIGWIIGQSREAEVRDILIEAMKPEAEHVLTSGEWILFRSTKPQASLTSPDVPADFQAATVLNRVNRISFARFGSPLPPDPVQP